MNNKYDDIINLPHHVSKNHPRMSIYDRSAQFAPFAALTGYDDSIKEAGREVDEKIILGIDKIDEISNTIIFLNENIESHPKVKLTYFVIDKRKEGGRYFDIESEVVRVNNKEKYLLLQNRKKIKFSEIIDIEIVK